MTVKIYQLDRAFSFFVWLCDRHAKKRQREGFQVKGRKTVDWELPCQDCLEEQKEQQ